MNCYFLQWYEIFAMYFLHRIQGGKQQNKSGKQTKEAEQKKPKAQTIVDLDSIMSRFCFVKLICLI